MGTALPNNTTPVKERTAPSGSSGKATGHTLLTMLDGPGSVPFMRGHESNTQTLASG